MSAKTVGLLFWLLVGGLAAAAVYWQLTHPPRPPAIPKAAQTTPGLPVIVPTPPFKLPLPERFGEIVARPVFIAARRPEPPAPPDEEPAPKPVATSEQKFLLLGVIIAPSMRVALLRPEEPNAKTARVKLGEMLGEWRLEAIFPNRVVIRKDQATQELALARPKKPAGSRAKPASDRDLLPGEMPAAPQPEALPSSIIPPPPQPQNDG
ncbi:MAG: hypothetical protein IPK63_08160 [Candidatus Competibacteraceae bacterium]|nr:hypothetical protein [Candidatus Competibacteraceae bacterium]